MVINTNRINEYEKGSGIDWSESPIWYLIIGIEQKINEVFKLGDTQAGYVLKSIIDFLSEADIQNYRLNSRNNDLSEFFYEFFREFCANEGIHFQLRILELNFTEINEIVANTKGYDLYTIIDQYWSDMLYHVMQYIIKYWINEDNIRDYENCEEAD